MSKQLLEETQAPPASHPDQEAVRSAADLPDLSARLHSRQQLIRQRHMIRREITVLTLASIAMAVLLIGGVLLSQHPAPTTSSPRTLPLPARARTLLPAWLSPPSNL